jgi:hypothetical protein
VTSPVITIDPGVVTQHTQWQIADADRFGQVPAPMSGGPDPDDPTVGAAAEGIDTVHHVRRHMAEHSARHAHGQQVASNLLTSQDEDNQAKIQGVAGMGPKDQAEMMRGLAKDGLSMLTQATTALVQGSATAMNGLIQATSTTANMATQIGTSLAKAVQDAGKGGAKAEMPVHAEGPPGGGVGGVGAEGVGAQTSPAAARYPLAPLAGAALPPGTARTERQDRDATQPQTVGYMPPMGGMGASGMGARPTSATASTVRRFTVVTAGDHVSTQDTTTEQTPLTTPVTAQIKVA